MRPWGSAGCAGREPGLLLRVGGGPDRWRPRKEGQEAGYAEEGVLSWCRMAVRRGGTAESLP